MRVGPEDGVAGCAWRTHGRWGRASTRGGRRSMSPLASWTRSAPWSRRLIRASRTRWRSRWTVVHRRWTLWNTLTPEQQAATDPDFAAQAELGAAMSSLEVQRLQLRRGELGSLMRQFMMRYDVLVTPAVAVPAFDARPAGHAPMTPESMLGFTPFSYPFNLTQQPAITVPCGPTSRRTTHRPAARRPDVRRRPRPACRPRLRTPPPCAPPTCGNGFDPGQLF